MGKLRKTGISTLATLGLTAALTLTSATITEAGFRGSSGGFRSSSSFRSSTFSGSRSYSRPSPSYRSNNTKVENHYYGGGGGGFSSGGFLSGYLWGSLLSHPTPAAPSVVVVPGAAAPAASPVSPNVSTAAPIAPTQVAPAVVQQQPEEADGGAGFWTYLLIVLAVIGVVLFVRNRVREGEPA
jgi:hypothetical protein